MSGPLGIDGDVTAFQWTSDGSRILYLADQVTDHVSEVWSSLPAGGGNLNLSGPLTASGSVQSFLAP